MVEESGCSPVCAASVLDARRAIFLGVADDWVDQNVEVYHPGETQVFLGGALGVCRVVCDVAVAAQWWVLERLVWVRD